MPYKTLTPHDVARIAAAPLDYDWSAHIGNGFIAATDADHPRLSQALEALNIHGAADIVVGAAEWCLARSQAHVPPQDAQWRLQSAWAATVDPRYSTLASSTVPAVAPEDLWSRPERRARLFLQYFADYLQDGWTAKVRQIALGLVLMADHLCGRDPAFATWLRSILQARTASSPRHADDLDYTTIDHSAPTPQELTAPGRAERLADLDPASNPYLRSAADMAALGFVGDPYPADL